MCTKLHLHAEISENLPMALPCSLQRLAHLFLHHRLVLQVTTLLETADCPVAEIRCSPIGLAPKVEAIQEAVVVDPESKRVRPLCKVAACRH